MAARRSSGAARGRGAGSGGKRRSGVSEGRGKSGSRQGSISGEFALLAKVRRLVASYGRGRGVLVGIGDDCAVVESPSRPLILTTDTMVEGVHFRADWLSPRELGVRAFRASVSDIASMGAAARYVLLSLEIPTGFAQRDAFALVRAVASESHRAGAALVGGNVSGGPRLAVTVTVVGEAVGEPLLRSGARAGDLVFVTGSLGGSAAGCRVLSSASSAVRSVDTAAYRRPPVRLGFAAALAKAGLARAMVDVSDGLLQDLGHIAEESHVAIRIDPAAVPVHPAAARQRGTAAANELPLSLQLALGGGEDYELAFTAPSSQRSAIERLAARHRTRVSTIGVVAKGARSVTDPEGRPFALAEAGFDHLRPHGAAKTVRRRSPGTRTRR